MGFEKLGLDPSILEGIEAMGFTEPTPVQEKAIPAIIEGRDLIGASQTGTGKTGAFVLPILHHVLNSKADGKVKALIICPTRELAVQIDRQIEGMSYFAACTSCAVYGGGTGSDFDREKKALQTGADIIIGTPGRLISHLSLGYVDTSQIAHFILDEADKMLEMGFIDDIMRIAKYLPEKRQNILFSATMPSNILHLAKKMLTNPVEIKFQISKPAEGIIQIAYLVYNKDKIRLLKKLLGDKELNRVLIFSSTKKNVKRIRRDLKSINANVDEVHSDLVQKDREQALLDFKNMKTQVIVATDVLSRGIDIEDIEIVINFDVPSDGEDYVHRIGRTARASKTGLAITFIGEDDIRKFMSIEKLIEREVQKLKVPEEIGESPEYVAGKSFGRKGGYKGKRNFKKKR
ncbi:MAG: DEAD/DEAH box helicase [Flavobacteriales bacterium]|nr:DEAD/DEAH box helicase [Flavobacteriales bacterium]